MADTALQESEAEFADLDDGDGLPSDDEAQGKESPFDIEIVDDVPEEDQRSRPTGDRLDPDSDEFAEEIKSYGDDVQARFKSMKFEFHEERRAKEAASREKDAAAQYAGSVKTENENLRAALDKTNNAYFEEVGTRTGSELEIAKSKWKKAYEDGDTDEMIEAQADISRLQVEQIRATNQAARQAQAPQAPQAQAPQPQANPNIGVPDEKAMGWVRKNTWFHTPGHEDKTGYAIGLHEKLVRGGMDPTYHEEYYTKIDEGLRTAFPDHFKSSEKGNGRDGDPPAATARKKPPPVGGPTRGGTPPRKVQLTSSQVAIAKRLGITNEQYAAQVVKEQQKEAANG